MSNVPMSNPEMMLTCHEPFPTARGATIQLGSGRVISCSGCGFTYSDDAGMTWCDHYEGRYVNGETPKLQDLVELEDGILGATEPRFADGVTDYAYTQPAFTTSEDMGRTWSEPKMMTKIPLPGQMYLNTLFRTSRGRIIQPTQFGVRQHCADDWWPRMGDLGGWDASGRFVSTGAHYYDPAFCSCYVLYSDDNGQTWQKNADGELHIFMPPEVVLANAVEPTVAEVEPGVLIMMLRTRLGRAFQSWSYNDGTTWTRPAPTHLASSNSPVVVKRLHSTGHLLCVWNQAGEQDIKQGHIRCRLSSAVCRNGGSIWEFFQNVESALEPTHVEPGPIRYTAPQGRYNPERGGAAYENDTRYTVELKTGARWTNHSVCVLDDRVLILYASKCKVLPIKWFYRGHDPQDTLPWTPRAGTRLERSPGYRQLPPQKE